MSAAAIDNAIPYSYAKRHGILVLGTDEGHTVYYHTVPKSTVLNELHRHISPQIMYQQLSADEFDRMLVEHYQSNSAKRLQSMATGDENLDLPTLVDAIPESTEVLDQEGDAPIIRLINGFIAEAIRQSASDIHLASTEHELRVRFRVDGILRDVIVLKRSLAPLIVSRIKVMAKLDIAERRVPQDGRIAVSIGGRDVDLRISTMPANFGERVVLRLLDKKAGHLSLDRIGLSSDYQEALKSLLHLPHGIVLVTGPTGSGKSTTLYAGLSYINNGSRNILTIEDPIEYQVDGIGQTQVNPKAGMNFANGLRAMLRQDPDVVMVGEIRDADTMQIAIQASLTGHLVLSTLHTNTAVGAITRLIDMGLESFLIASTLSAVIAQRLVRMLCPECREAYTPDEFECQQMNVAPCSDRVWFRANEHGCKHCTSEGYRGRTALYEVITMNDEMKALIHDSAPESELTSVARRQHSSLRDDGLHKIEQGVTSLNEVIRVSNST